MQQSSPLPSDGQDPAPAVFLRMPSVMQLTGLGRSTIYRLMAQAVLAGAARLGMFMGAFILITSHSLDILITTMLSALSPAKIRTVSRVHATGLLSKSGIYVISFLPHALPRGPQDVLDLFGAVDSPGVGPHPWVIHRFAGKLIKVFRENANVAQAGR
ncbi:hypothetical protein D9M68_752840 [compost metagenome]